MFQAFFHPPLFNPFSVCALMSGLTWLCALTAMPFAMFLSHSIADITWSPARLRPSTPIGDCAQLTFDSTHKVTLLAPAPGQYSGCQLATSSTTPPHWPGKGLWKLSQKLLSLYIHGVKWGVLAAKNPVSVLWSPQWRAVWVEYMPDITLYSFNSSWPAGLSPFPATVWNIPGLRTLSYTEHSTGNIFLMGLES